jgi:hypothetical protein
MSNGNDPKKPPPPPPSKPGGPTPDGDPNSPPQFRTALVAGAGGLVGGIIGAVIGSCLHLH